MRRDEVEKHYQRINNRAELTGESIDNTSNECCYNHLLFALRDNYHEFTLGIETVLQCLYAAEKQGVVPPLSDKWWIEIMAMYNIKFPRFEERQFRII